LTLERGPDGEVLGMTVVDKQQHVLQDAGVVPSHPGLPMDAGKNAMKTMSSSGQGAVDTFSPKRTH
jgi:hypothetical protein